MNRHRRKRLSSGRRKGAAVAELAVCLPAMMLLAMGALECCTMIYLRQSLHIAAYEGIRVAISDDASAAEALQRAQQVIDDRNIADAAIAITPAQSEFEPRGNPITVQVSAPSATNAALPLRFFTGDISATAVMIKE